MNKFDPQDLRENVRATHAFLILAHHQPQHLKRLVAVLSHERTHTCVHIDRKSLGLFDENLRSLCNVSSRDISWGGVQMVHATLDLLECAYQTQSNQTFTLLSGSDFPLKPINELVLTLDGITRSRIDYWKDEDTSWFRRYERYYFNDQKGLAKRLLNGVSRRLAQAIPKRNFFKGLTPFFGSQWWTLTREGVECVLRFTALERQFLDYCKFVHCPDELYFQTILLNQLGPSGVKRDPMRYLDWTERRANPKTLTIVDLEKLLASRALFARKFAEYESGQLINALLRIHDQP